MHLKSIQSIAKLYADDIESVRKWCDDFYEKYFSEHLSGFRDAFNRLKKSGNKITDDELETLLITLPIRLFDASEVLSGTKIALSTVRIGIKQKESKIITKCKESGNSAAASKEMAANSVLDDQILVYAYDSIINRVESEISFCREIIMSAKKIWDARRRTESANPVSPVESLPDFVPDDRTQSYIRGV